MVSLLLLRVAGSTRAVSSMEVDRESMRSTSMSLCIWCAVYADDTDNDTQSHGLARNLAALNKRKKDVQAERQRVARAIRNKQKRDNRLINRIVASFTAEQILSLASRMVVRRRAVCSHGHKSSR